MRIIAGKAGRIAIKVPPAVTRPTTDFVRQAIFSILGDNIHDAATLDLFAGSGAIGLEALSRGAKSCAFVDEHRQATSTIEENLRKSKLTGGQVTKANAVSFLKRDAQQYDLIFADPPYWKHYGDTDHIGDLLKDDLIAPRLKPNGYFIAEVNSHQPSPPSESLSLVNRREYGNCAILLYEAKSAS